MRGDFHFDGEAEIYFPPELLSLVAEMAGARKKRQLSPEARARLAEQGKATRFKGTKHGVEDAKTAPIWHDLPQAKGVWVRSGPRVR